MKSTMSDEAVESQVLPRFEQNVIIKNHRIFSVKNFKLCKISNQLWQRTACLCLGNMGTIFKNLVCVF